MQQDNIKYKELAEMVRSGAYYKTALEWYSDIYHSPIAERCLFVFIAFASVVVSLISVMASLSLQANLKPVVSFIYENPDAMQYMPKLVRLAEPGEKTKVAIPRFLIKHYVVTRESYDPLAAYSASFNHIRATSEKAVFNAYRKSVDLRNSKSPFIVYQKHTKRKIEITDINLFLENEPYQAIVEFTEILDTQGKIRGSRWTAEVNFKYKDVKVNQDTGEIDPIQFLITGYKSQQKSE